MSKWSWIQLATIIVATGAAYVSFNLYKKHFNQHAPSWFEAGCGDSQEPGAPNCDAVIKGEWGVIRYTVGETKAGKPRELVVPTALLGTVYYAAIAAWFIGVGRPSRQRSWVHLAPSVVVTGGFTFSVFLTYKMFTSDHYCNWCLLTHGCNLIILAAVVALWFSYSAEAAPAAATAEGDAANTGTSTVATMGHPALRTVGITLLAMLTTAVAIQYYGGYLAAEALARRRDNEKRTLMSYVKEVQNDAVTLMTNWDLAQRHEFKITDDSPVRILTKAPSMQMVVFSDFECPHCRRFALFVEQQIQPLFANRMMVAYKHYPINTRCNPQVKSLLHKNACMTAAFAEAARMQGGTDKFWEAHDYFYHDGAMVRGLVPDDVEKIKAMAVELKLDPEKLVADMQSPDIGERVLADIEEATAAGVTSTPGVFVNGKRVNQLAIMQWPFWREMARLYWKTLGETPPAEVTKLLNSYSAPKVDAAATEPGTGAAADGSESE